MSFYQIEKLYLNDVLVNKERIVRTNERIFEGEGKSKVIIRFRYIEPDYPFFYQ